MRSFLILSSLFSLSQLVACGPDCQSTCNRIYEEAECNIQQPNKSVAKSKNECLRSCGEAMEKPGPMGDYQPNERSSSSESKEQLKTDKQAAAWMDCIANTSCEHLDENYCAPIF